MLEELAGRRQVALRRADVAPGLDDQRVRPARLPSGDPAVRRAGGHDHVVARAAVEGPERRLQPGAARAQVDDLVAGGVAVEPARLGGRAPPAAARRRWPAAVCGPPPGRRPRPGRRCAGGGGAAARWRPSPSSCAGTARPPPGRSAADGGRAATTTTRSPRCPSAPRRTAARRARGTGCGAWAGPHRRAGSTASRPPAMNGRGGRSVADRPRRCGGARGVRPRHRVVRREPVRGRHQRRCWRPAGSRSGRRSVRPRPAPRAPTRPRDTIAGGSTPLVGGGASSARPLGGHVERMAGIPSGSGPATIPVAGPTTWSTATASSPSRTVSTAVSPKRSARVSSRAGPASRRPVRRGPGPAPESQAPAAPVRRPSPCGRGREQAPRVGTSAVPAARTWRSACSATRPRGSVPRRRS